MSEEMTMGAGLEDLFTFTRSSYLNNLITEAKNIYEDDFDPDFFTDDYREKLTMFRELSEKLREFHDNLKKILEDSPVIIEQSELIARNFDRLFEGVRIMEEYLDYKEKDKIIEGLKIVKAVNEAIFSSIDLITLEESRLDRYSKSPYVHELLRIGKGVISKGYPKEALKEKLGWMMDYCERVHSDFQIYKGARFETAAIQEKIPDTEEALEKFRNGLEMMEQYFIDEESSKLEKGMEMVKEGSDVLVEVYDLIQQELKSSSLKYCVKCGESNTLTNKFCSKCSALLPETKVASDSEAFDTRAGSGGDGEKERQLSSNIIRLTDVVNEYCEGRAQEEELLKVIEWMEEKVQTGINMLQNVGPVGEEESAEDREALEKMGELLATGTYELESALSEMRRFFEDGEAAHLKEGLGAVHEASYKIHQVQERCRFATPGA